MSSFYFDNAIAWAQIRMRGGWKGLLATSVGFAAGAAGLVGLLYGISQSDRDKMDMLAGASMIVMLLQSILILALGGLAISSAIRRDIQGKQIESHRLMPLGGVQAVVGYICGSGSRVFSFIIVNLLLGMALDGLRGIPRLFWLEANLVLISFGLMLWTIMAMAAFISRGIFWLVMVIMIAIPFSGGRILLLLPGLLILASPAQGQTVFDPGATGFQLSNIFLVSVAAQLIVSLVCLRAAARKYARQDAVVLPAGSSLALLAIWIGLSWIGMNFCTATHTNWGGLEFWNSDWRLMVVGSFAGALIVALLTIAGEAWHAIDRQHQRSEGKQIPRWNFKLVYRVAVAMVLIATLLLARPEDVQINNTFTQGIFRTQVLHSRHVYILSIGQALGILTACAIFLVQIYVLMRIFYRVAKWANLLIGFCIGILWFAPMILDGIYWQVVRPDFPAPMNFITRASPLGSIYWQLTHSRLQWGGLVAQVAVLLFLLGLFALVQGLLDRRLKKKIAAESLRSQQPVSPPPLQIPVNMPVSD